MRIAVASLMHHRIELSFFEEWIDYHQKLGVDIIYLGVDISKEAGVDISKEADKGKSKNLKPYVWAKHPKYDYHDDLSHREIIDIWQRRMNKIKGVRYFLMNLPMTKILKRQKNFLKRVYLQYRHEFDFFTFIDGDELLVPQMEDSLRPIIEQLADNSKYSFFGLKQCRFAPRWKSPGVVHESVFDITTTRGVTTYGNPEPFRAFKYFVRSKTQLPKAWLRRTPLHPLGLTRACHDEYTTIPLDDLLIYHFQGWESNYFSQTEEMEKFDTIEDRRHCDLRAYQSSGGS